MNSKEKFYPEAQFGGFTDIDGTMAFFNRVNSLLKPSFVILDVGCGRGSYAEDSVQIRRNLRIIQGKVSKVIGIDVDQNAQHNPFLDEFHLIQGNSWPLDDNSIDLIICDNVLEHVCNPDTFFAEIYRVLKHNGLLCIRTPNRWSYIALAATVIPNKYHSKVTSIVQDGRKDEDVFPTVYKCNSVKRLRRIMNKNGFEHVVYGYEAEPSYLSFSGVAYFLGVLHQKFAPGFLKPAIFAFGRIKK
ncbi:MAG: class I SAM-dependent methyltransferase [Candidatus Competibacter sp.]|nr:class I SAM-dependent methyltransferase [Ignavibacteria bacterium]